VGDNNFRSEDQLNPIRLGVTDRQTDRTKPQHRTTSRAQVCV